MKSKKQIGMYSISLDEDGALQIQAPTLLRPLQLDTQQAQELQHWLNEVNPPAGSQPAISPMAAPATAPVDATPPVVATTPAPVAPSPVTTESAPVPVGVAPATIAQQIIQEMIANANAQYPASLAPENRDRFIDQITRHPAIRPLMSQGKVSFKQIMLWAEQAIAAGQ